MEVRRKNLEETDAPGASAGMVSAREEEPTTLRKGRGPVSEMRTGTGFVGAALGMRWIGTWSACDSLALACKRLSSTPPAESIADDDVVWKVRAREGEGNG